MNAHKFVAEKGIDEAKRVLGGAPKKSTHFNNLDDKEYDNYVIIKQEWSEKNKHAYYQKDALSNTFRWDFMPNKFAEYDLLIDAIDLKELKQVVESVNKINDFGGIGLANLIDQSTYGENLDLDRAIADYKLVQVYKNGEA